MDTLMRTDAITDGISRLIAEGGIDLLTTRAIAARAGISVGTLANHLTSRERVIRVCGSRFSRRRLDDLRNGIRRAGLRAFLPQDELGLMLTRVWLAWREIARSDEALAATVAAADDEERPPVADGTRARGAPDWRLHWRQQQDGVGAKELPGDETLDLLGGVVQGLRDSMCRVERPMSLDQAQSLLSTAASALARSSATILSGSSAE